jgi:hypothetical protein
MQIDFSRVCAATSRCYQSIADTFVQLFHMGTSVVIASSQSNAIEDMQRL